MNYKRLFIENSLVFITVVTKNRKPILVDNIAYLKKAFVLTKQKYSFSIIAIIINKDHFHMIIKPENIEFYPKIVGCIKSTFTKISDIKHFQNNNRESDIWQRRYWEHTIINEKDLYKHIDYIHYNSMKHYNISPKDWEFSSFHKYVKNGFYENDWCNCDDINKINELDFE